MDDKKAQRLSDKAVIIRWHKLFKGTVLTHKYPQGEKLDKAQQLFLSQTIEQYRTRLADISWFMRILNEDIARKANREDKCTGRFYSLPPMVLPLRVD